MESQINTYKLNQGDKEYILTICTVGDRLQITCKSASNERQKYSRDYSIDDLRRLDQIFGTFNTINEALEYLDKALKVQKVGVVEEGEVIKINFYFANQTENTQNVNQEYTTYDMNQNITLEQTTPYDEYKEIQNQYIEGNDNINAQYTETIDNTTDILQNLNLNSAQENITTTNYAMENQYMTPTEDLTAKYTTEVQDYTQYTTGATEEYATGDLNGQYTDTTNTKYISEYDANNYNMPSVDTNNYLDNLQSTTQTVETTTTNYYQPEQSYDTQPYITPVEEPVDFTQINNYDTTNIYEQTTTTTTTTETTQNEHQLIQDKINALSGEMNEYKTKLELIERQRAQNEVNQLRAENMAIKQQLSELNNLRNDAAEVRVLRSQLSQLDPLRRKVAEMDALRGQLNELNSLREKEAELNSAKAQLGELNELKTKLAELSGVKSQLDELNNLRSQVGEIDFLKQQINQLSSLKDDAMDIENLKRKIKELEAIKLQYEQEIKSLRETQTIECRKLSETKLRSKGMDSKKLLFEDKPQQICVKGDIIHNTDELGLLTRNMNKLNQRLTLNLLYKATADSDKAEAFHTKCDEAKSTLVLIETDKGKRFGGFTTCSWAGDCIDKKDENAFVFSLDKMEIYENIPGEDAIGCYPKFGPIFLGCQIRIYDNAFTKGGTTFEKGLNYNTEEDFELTGGDRMFNVREIEVYEVIPQ